MFSCWPNRLLFVHFRFSSFHVLVVWGLCVLPHSLPALDCRLFLILINYNIFFHTDYLASCLFGVQRVVGPAMLWSIRVISPPLLAAAPSIAAPMTTLNCWSTGTTTSTPEAIKDRRIDPNTSHLYTWTVPSLMGQ